MKKGLILEGGALRGVFSAGVIDVLVENNVEFDSVIGVSAGACFGCNYNSGQVGRVIRYNMKYAKDARYCSIKNLIKTGDIFEAKFCYHTLPMELDVFDVEAFERSKADFYVVATDIESGEPVYKRLDTIDNYGMEWIRASASMPLCSNIVEIDGGKYLDGGISDSIPLKASKDMGNEINVTVMTQPRGYRKNANALMPIVKHYYKEYPELVKAMAVRHIMYNDELGYVFEEEKAGHNFVIAPKAPLPIGRITHDRDKLKETYEIGRQLMKELLPSLYRFLEINA